MTKYKLWSMPVLPEYLYDQIVKNFGIKFGTKFTMTMVKKIPGSVLTKINQKVGFRLITKFGSKGLINLGKAIPVVGGIIGGGFDFSETKIIANRAYKMFIDGNFNVLSGNIEETIDITEGDES